MIRVFDPAIANGFASQLTCLVVGLGLFPIYLDGKCTVLCSLKQSRTQTCIYLYIGLLGHHSLPPNDRLLCPRRIIFIVIEVEIGLRLMYMLPFCRCLPCMVPCCGCLCRQRCTTPVLKLWTTPLSPSPRLGRRKVPKKSARRRATRPPRLDIPTSNPKRKRIQTI